MLLFEFIEDLFVFFGLLMLALPTMVAFAAMLTLRLCCLLAIFVLVCTMRFCFPQIVLSCIKLFLLLFPSFLLSIIKFRLDIAILDEDLLRPDVVQLLPSSWDKKIFSVEGLEDFGSLFFVLD